MKQPEIINKSIYKGIAGAMGRKPIGIFLHNDAGSIYATAKSYLNSLLNRRPELGFAHYYIDRNTIFRSEDTYNRAWHCGQSDGNNFYLSYEVCQSIGASVQDFLLNELMCLRQVAEDMTYYGIPANAETVKLHKEVYATACPHRSVELHDGTAKTKAYFIEKIKYFQSLGKTVKEMIEAEEKLSGKVTTKVVERAKEIEIAQEAKPSVFGLASGLYEFGSWREATKYSGLDYPTAGALRVDRTDHAVVLTWDTFNGRHMKCCMVYGKTAGWKDLNNKWA